MLVASINVLLPPDFHGTIILATTNSKGSLSAALQAKSVRIPNGPDEKNKSASWYEIDGPGGDGRAELRSTNGKVQAGFVDDAQATEEGGSCSVM